MIGLRAVALHRLREAIAGRMFWLLPIHFLLAFAAARAMPGPTPEARIEAADTTALAMAAALGLVAAASMGAAPLADERLRPRGALLLGAPISPGTRVLGTFLGTGAALLLLTVALGASAMAAVDVGAGRRTLHSLAYLRASRIVGEPDPKEPGLVWTPDGTPVVQLQFPRRLQKGDRLVVEARVRLVPGGNAPGMKAAVWRFADGRIQDGTLTKASEDVVRTRAALHAPFRLEVPVDCDSVLLFATKDDYYLGVRREDVRLLDGTRPRAYSRGFHAAALGAGLLALMAAAMALSTVAGTGVAAAGSLTLAVMSLFRSTFAEAAATLSSAGAMERAMEASGSMHTHVEAGTPPALAPVFRAVAAILPDGSRFDLAQAVAANEVPDAGDVAFALLYGAVLTALFLGVAALGARRRP